MGDKEANIYIRHSTREDCFEIGRKLRKDDYIELCHIYGVDEKPGWILDSERMAHQDETFTLLINDEIVGLGGCAETQPGVGCPWFMGTDCVGKYRFSFHSVALHLVEYWRSQFAILSNFVWDGSASKPWLERIGFAMMPEISYVTESGGEFRRFYLSGEDKECVDSPPSCSASKQQVP